MTPGRQRAYRTWSGMKERCNDSTYGAFHVYGGRGITICQRWMDFSNFFADMGERPAGKTIDRIDNNGNYEPGNCRWATQEEQSRNRRTNIMITVNGETMCAVDWSKRLGMERSVVAERIRERGYDPVLAATLPAHKTQRKSHCQRGHAMEGHNVLIDGRGKRRCRACMNRPRRKQ